jgi:hypothetical protein
VQGGVVDFGPSRGPDGDRALHAGKDDNLGAGGQRSSRRNGRSTAASGGRYTASTPAGNIDLGGGATDRGANVGVSFTPADRVGRLGLSYPGLCTGDTLSMAAQGMRRPDANNGIGLGRGDGVRTYSQSARGSSTGLGSGADGNKSLYLVFVGRVIFLSILDCF